VKVGQAFRQLVKAAVPWMSSSNSWPIVRESSPGAWQRNIVLDNRECILAFSAVYACVTRIANDIAKLRIKLVEQTDGLWSEVVHDSPFAPVLRKPNRYQNRIQFLVDWMLMKLLHGNTYVLKETDQRGIVVAMYVLDSRRVRALVTPDGGVYYQLSTDHLNGLDIGVTVPASRIIHDRGPTLWHPLCGVSPIYACGSSATQGNRIQANSAKFFENMSRPGGILTSPGTIDDVTALRLKAEFEQGYSGANIGRLYVAGDGLKYEAMTIPANDAQLIQQLQWTVADVARAFGMPLYKIGAGEVPTNNNVEALQQQYYTDCLQILLEALELCLDEGLSLPKGMGVELDLDGLLRMDEKAQMAMLADGVKHGIVKPNEARAKRNLKPVAGGDSIWLQEQYHSLEALAKRDESDEWFAGQESPPDDEATEMAFALIDRLKQMEAPLAQ
jgi:HK97 family phage portal protein